MRLFALMCAAGLCASAQDMVLTQVQVSDISDRPIPHVILSAKGASSTSPPTDKAGKTHLALPGSVVPGSIISLVLVDAPNASLRFLSPWQGHATIPLHEEVDVVLGVPGDPSLLNNLQVRQSIRGAVVAQGAGGGPGARPGGPQGPVGADDALKSVSAEIGLKPADVSAALQRFAKNDAAMRGVSQQHHHLPPMAGNSGGNNAMTGNTSLNSMSNMQSRSHKH